MGIAGAMSAVLVVEVLEVAVIRDMHVFTDGRIGMIGTGGTVTKYIIKSTKYNS